MAIERTATCTWTGQLVEGSGTVGAESGAFQLPVTWASRTGEPGGMTSPEELIAAAHASCFSMALSHGLAEAGHPPIELQVSATITLDPIEGVPTVTTSDLEVIGAVPGIDAGEFIQLATEAGKNCPISRALEPLAITVIATLRDMAPETEKDHDDFDDDDLDTDGFDDPEAEDDDDEDEDDYESE